jgi:hypothetical protein
MLDVRSLIAQNEMNESALAMQGCSWASQPDSHSVSGLVAMNENKQGGVARGPKSRTPRSDLLPSNAVIVVLTRTVMLGCASIRSTR